MSNILTERYTPEQLQGLPPKTRALAQQDIIIPQLFAQYRNRIAAYLTHQDNARHINPNHLNQDVAAWKNASDHTGQTQIQSNQVTDADRRAYLTSVNHPQRAAGRTNELARSPIVSKVETRDINIDHNGEPTQRSYTITFATQKDVAPDPKAWKKTLVSNHIERDLKHIFGDENVLNYDLDNGTYRANLNGGDSSYFKSTVTFKLPLINRRIILGPVAAAKDVANKVKMLARISGASYHDALNKIREACSIPLTESLTDLFSIKAKKQHNKCAILCNITEVSENALYMTSESEWTDDLNEAYITTFDEAEELLASMMFAGRINTGVVVKIH